MFNRQESLNESSKLREALIRFRIFKNIERQYDCSKDKLNKILEGLNKDDHQLFLRFTGQVDNNSKSRNIKIALEKRRCLEIQEK